MNDKQRRALLCAVLALLYAAGLLLMLLRRTEAGLLLWLVSTVGGMAVLYFQRRAGQAKSDAKERDDTCE